MGPVGSTEYAYITDEGPAPLRVSFTLQGSYGKVQSAVENFNPTAFIFGLSPSFS